MLVISRLIFLYFICNYFKSVQGHVPLVHNRRVDGPIPQLYICDILVTTQNVTTKTNAQICNQPINKPR